MRTDFDNLRMMQAALGYLKAYKDQNAEVMDVDDLEGLEDLINDMSEIVEMNEGVE